MDRVASWEIAEEQAAVLADPMDEGIFTLSNVSLKETRDSNLIIAVKVNLFFGQSTR